MGEDLRASTAGERLALKAAVRRAAKMAGGGASVQHALRVGEADLSRYGSPEHAARHCPIDVALDLDREAGAPVIVAALAGLLGYRLVLVDAEPAQGVTPDDISAVTVETAEAVKALCDRLGKGPASAADKAAIHKEIEEAVAALRTAQAHVGV